MDCLNRPFPEQIPDLMKKKTPKGGKIPYVLNVVSYKAAFGLGDRFWRRADEASALLCGIGSIVSEI